MTADTPEDPLSAAEFDAQVLTEERARRRDQFLLSLDNAAQAAIKAHAELIDAHGHADGITALLLIEKLARLGPLASELRILANVMPAYTVTRSDEAIG